MEFHSGHKVLHPNHLGEEKQQMLNLNRRLETYLNRVKHLEEENSLLAQELQAMRHHSQGAHSHRRSKEEELRQARLAVEAVWRDRLVTELEVGKLAEELRVLDEERQREAQAKGTAKTRLEQSRRELEEERRAQTWLRERVAQLEHEMRLLVQNHQEDLAHIKLTHSRVSAPHAPPPRVNQDPNLLQLGQEYSQRATRAWQEAAEAHRGQLAQLEESLSQARDRLALLDQERREGQLKLRVLEEEMSSAQERRRHLERMAGQQRDVHDQEVQQLQEHLEGLEVEKEVLGEQIHRLVLENQSLLQLKMSLGLEVATYRALLDGEGLRVEVPLSRPKKIYITDAVFSSQGVKKNYPPPPASRHNASSFTSVRSKAEPASWTPICSRAPATKGDALKVSGETAAAAKSVDRETPDPKIHPAGAIEGFTPQKVYEKATREEAPSPSDEKEEVEADEKETSKDVEPPEGTPVVETVGKHQVEFGLSSEPSLSSESGFHQFESTSLEPSGIGATEELCGSSGSDMNVAVKEEDAPQRLSQALVDTWVKEESVCNEEANDGDEVSDSETEALQERTWESRPSSPESESETEDIVTEFNLDGNISDEEIDEKKLSVVGGSTAADVEDKLYPDGEEMDTWDSVIERKVDLEMSGAVKTNEGRGQHAEPEEDISAKEPEAKLKESTQECVSDVKQEDNVAFSQMVTKQVDDEQQAAQEGDLALLSDRDEDDDEDSQNVSVSWRTELENDSYAQDNTLADTRPLIRYKSDEADASTVASHMDESESSEGEQDRKVAETGTWSQDKSKQFGTMEDLCEEVEGEIMDEEYLEDTQTEDMVAGHEVVKEEQRVLVSDAENVEEIVRKPNKEHPAEETEERAQPTHVEDDEELTTDKLVEQKLENQCAEQQVSEEMDESVKETEKSEEAGETKPDDTCEKSVHQNLITSTAVTDQTSENLFSLVETSHTDTLSVPLTAAEEEITRNVAANSEVKEAEGIDASGKSQVNERVADSPEIYDNQPLAQEDDPRGASKESQEQTVEDFLDLLDNLRCRQPDDVGEAIKESQEQLFADVADYQELRSSPPAPQLDDLLETSKESQEKLVEDVACSRELSGSLSESLMQTIGETQGQPVGGVAEFQELSGSLEQPQVGVVKEPTKETQEQVEDVEVHQEPSSSHKQPQSEGQLEALKESQDQLVEEVAEIHELFPSPQLTKSENVMHAREETREKPVGDVSSCPELSGNLQLPQQDDVVGASKETLEQIVGNVAGWQELSESLQQGPSFIEESKKAQEEQIGDVAPSQELFGNLEQPQKDLPVPTEAFKHMTEDDPDWQEFPEAPEWEVLENPGDKFETQSDLKSALVVGPSDEGQEKPPEVSPDSAPGEHDIFVMQDATDDALSGFFPPGVKNDFWVSSLEGGATVQPDDARNEAAEQANQNVGFVDSLVWGVSDQQNVVNGNSRVDSSSLGATKKEQKQVPADVKQVACRNVVEGELVHSEESEVEGESWSSDE